MKSEILIHMLSTTIHYYYFIFLYYSYTSQVTDIFCNWRVASFSLTYSLLCSRWSSAQALANIHNRRSVLLSVQYSPSVPTYFNYLNEVATLAFVVTCNVLLSSMHFVTGRRDGISEHPKLVLSRLYQSNSPDHYEFLMLSQYAGAHFRQSIINNYE